MNNIKQHSLFHLSHTKVKSSDQANAILRCISLAMDDSLQDVVVVVSVVTSKDYWPITRLKLAGRLLLREELTVKYRNRVMLAMVSIAEVEVGKDKCETLNLHCEAHSPFYELLSQHRHNFA